MSVRDYLWFLLLLFVDIVALAEITFAENSIFLTQFFVLLVSLMIATLFMFGIYRGEEWGYQLAGWFFTLHLLNAVYLAVINTQALIILLVVLNALGFLMSITHIRLFKDQQQTLQRLLPQANKQYIDLTTEELREVLLKDVDTFTEELEERKKALSEIPQIDDLTTAGEMRTADMMDKIYDEIRPAKVSVVRKPAKKKKSKRKKQSRKKKTTKKKKK